ncbi:MAG: ribosome biogenesis GTP-binding protein YihA/YsxC [Candidatus Paceibacterota bacterium]
MKITSAHFVKGVRGTDEILHDGTPQVAFIGRSNVGKSSLINALTDIKGLAKIGKKPGKTTEINLFLVNKAAYIVDLPGYGYAQATPKEREKLKKLIIWYFTASEARPKEVVIVLDVKAGLTEFDKDMLMILNEHKHPYMIAVNKCDKLTQQEVAAQVAPIREIAGGADVLTCSTKTGKGIDVLRDRLFQ